MKVLGVDVGLRTCGYVLCEVKKLEIDVIKEEEIKPNPRYLLPQRLNLVFEELEKEIIKYNLEAIVVEMLY